MGSYAPTSACDLLARYMQLQTRSAADMPTIQTIDGFHHAMFTLKVPKNALGAGNRSN
jgi:hypothetical protein